MVRFLVLVDVSEVEFSSTGQMQIQLCCDCVFVERKKSRKCKFFGRKEQTALGELGTAYPSLPCFRFALICLLVWCVF